MSESMSSRERYLTTFRHQEPDRVPVDLQPAGKAVLPGFRGWLGLRDHLDLVRQSGGDPIVDIWLPPETPHPDVKARKGTCGKDENGLTLLFAEWETPAGTLRSVVRETGDWRDSETHAHLENRTLGDGLRDQGDWSVHIFDDWNCSRFVEQPVKTIQDIEALKYLLRLPNEDELKRWRELVEEAKRIAAKHDYPVRARRTFGSEAGLWFMKTEDFLCRTVTEPDLIQAMTGVVTDWQMKRAEVALDAGVDILMHRGWYETPDYFGGERFIRFCKPFIDRLGKICRQSGTQLTYQHTKGNTQSVGVISDLPIDHLWGIEPGPGREDIAFLKREIGDRITLWGGVESTFIINQGTPDDVKTAVQTAMRTLAPGGGFVVMPTAYAAPEVADENLKTAIDTAIAYGKY